MARSRFYAAALAASLLCASPATAASFVFDTDPFAGSTALVTPGRQIVGGEPFITFDIANDVFVFDESVFGIGGTINFANDLVGNLPTSGLNVIVLQTAPSPFNAGLAANAIAAQITAAGPGFFIYFNSGLDLPRLVYSVDLNDETADLKVMARLTNLSGQPGRDALATFSASNFAIQSVPEPSSVLLMAPAIAWVYSRARRIRRSREHSIDARY